MTSQMLFGDFGGRELIFMAAIVCLLAAASRLTRLRRGRATEESPEESDAASSRAYLDPLIGRARARTADALPGTVAGPRRP